MSLSKAVELAGRYHGGLNPERAEQLEKNGNPYLLHALRVMLSLETPEERMAGVLHDVIEDTDGEATDLRAAGIPDAVITAVELLTRDATNKGPAYYDEYIAKIASNPIARRVKLADLSDNMNIKRLPNELTEKDLARLAKYHRVWRKLSDG